MVRARWHLGFSFWSSNQREGEIRALSWWQSYCQIVLIKGTEKLRLKWNGSVELSLSVMGPPSEADLAKLCGKGSDVLEKTVRMLCLCVEE